MTEEIVKVQISLFTSEDKPQVLVYNKDRTHKFSGDASEEIVELMDGEPKKFFHAELPDKKGFIKINEEAEWQDW